MLLFLIFMWVHFTWDKLIQPAQALPGLTFIWIVDVGGSLLVPKIDPLVKTCVLSTKGYNMIWNSSCGRRAKNLPNYPYGRACATGGAGW
jgi:hypothetical protein